MKYIAWCNILFVFCTVGAMAGVCPPNDGSWIETGSIPNPIGPISFDDRYYGNSVPWNSNSGTSLDVWNSGRTVTISNGGFVYNGESDIVYPTNWDGQRIWFDGSGYPGWYWNLAGNATTYGEMIFSVPVGMVSAKTMGNTNTFDTSRFEYYDENDKLIACITNITENTGLNVFVYRGVITTTPIKKIRIYSSVFLDDIGFADLVCKADSCDVNAKCFNAASNNGSVHCVCNDGYEGDGFTCSDKNECNTSPCVANAFCTNLPGTYNCTCSEGYTGNGYTECTDINECDIGLCSPLANCTNYIGSYNCTCIEGYTGDGLTCEDLDECAAGLCSPHATCVNYVPGFNCTCNAGYEGNGLTCADKDECLTSPCDVNANCTNTDGSYTCACNTGYEGDGVTCTVMTPSSTPGPGASTPGTKSPGAVQVSAALLNSLSLLVLGAGVLLLL